MYGCDRLATRWVVAGCKPRRAPEIDARQLYARDDGITMRPMNTATQRRVVVLFFAVARVAATAFDVARFALPGVFVAAFRFGAG